MSSDKLQNHFHGIRKKVLSECIVCGLCIESCSLSGYLSGVDSSIDVQHKVLQFLKDNREDAVVYRRAFSCLECFKCVSSCPKGIDPMSLNELIKHDYPGRTQDVIRYNDPGDKKSYQRILASIQVRRQDYRRISTEVEKENSEVLFFPGCNVYYQPEKILSALDIMELVTDNFAYLPGLDFCCGNEHLFYGNIERAQDEVQRLVIKLRSCKPQTLVVWCPTCLCRFGTTLRQAHQLPFTVVSFAQYVAANISKLHMKHRLEMKVTLHEACKSAYTKLDVSGARDIISRIPGVEFAEMKSHKDEALCCGLGVMGYSRLTGNAMRSRRMREAEDLKVDLLVDVCHACHSFFVDDAGFYNFEIVNYITLLARSLGIEREDVFQRYIMYKDIRRILDDPNTKTEESNFAREDVVKAIMNVIVNEKMNL